MDVGLDRARGRDIDSAEEITEMVRRFYADVVQDPLLGPMFDDVARVDWSEHLPKLAAFWSRILLSEPGYEGNPLRAHAVIHAQEPFTDAHFQRWLELFFDTVDTGWAGPRAEHAKAFAERVATMHSRALSRPEPLRLVAR